MAYAEPERSGLENDSSQWTDPEVKHRAFFSQADLHLPAALFLHGSAGKEGLEVFREALEEVCRSHAGLQRRMNRREMI